MAFVITLVLVLCLLLYAGNSKADKLNAIASYNKTHPPCKYQEEYLLACEYYHQFLFDGEQEQDARGNALFEARKKIFQGGYLPSYLASAGLSYYDESAPAMRTHSSFAAHYWIDPHDPPNGISVWKDHKYGEIEYTGFFDIRYEETNHTCLLTDLRNQEYKNDKKWAEYCKQLDEKFDSLVIQSLVDYGIVDGNTHEGSAYILERNNIGTLMNPTWSEYKKLEFATKWIDPDKLKDVPYKQREIIHYNGKEYEKILELHKDEIPSYLANRRIMQPLKPKQEPETPYGR